MCVDTLHLVSFAYCASGGEDAKGRSGGLLALRASFPGSTFHISSWPSRILRRIIRSALRGEALSLKDASDFPADVKLVYGNLFG